jgi:CBS domain-containing protein
LQPIRLETLVETDVVTTQRDTPIRTVVAQMAENDVGAVVVVEDDTPVGLLTDRQIALALEQDPDVGERTADDLVGGDLVAADQSMSVFDALQRMSEHDIRRLPVVGDDDTLEGIVTLDDILVLLSTELSRASDIIKAQSPRL